MSLNKVTFAYDDGAIKYLEGEDLTKWSDANKKSAVIAKIHGEEPFKDLNLQWKEEAPEFKLQRVYFSLVREICLNTNCGYKKAALHEALKPMLFSKIKDNNSYFKDNIVEFSTQKLTHDGWVAFIEELKELAQDLFNYQFKPE